jgi:hypothetical protein
MARKKKTETEQSTTVDTVSQHLSNATPIVLTTVASGQLTRKQVRKWLFALRDGYAIESSELQLAQGVKNIIVDQLRGTDYAFSQFTFDWDIHPTNPLKVIGPLEHDWRDGGGKIDHITGLRYPAAFTKQHGKGV